MSEYLHLVGGAKTDGSEPPAMPPSRREAWGIPGAAFCDIGGRQYQADAGSCVAHGYSAVVESWASKVVKADLQLCRQDIYFMARAMEGNGAERIDGGAYPSMARLALATRGTVTEARKPYAPSDVTTWRRPAGWEADARLLACQFERLPNDSEALLPLLADGNAIAICHVVYGSMVNLPTGGVEGAGGAPLGRHCRAIVGYDLTQDHVRGAFLVMNSWRGWGLPHPEAATDSRFVGYGDSFSWVPFRVLDGPNWLDDAAYLAVPPVGVEA